MRADLILALAREKSIRITTAESCTAGMIAAALTDAAGSSSVVECGFVTYSNNSKINLLGVSKETLETTGAVSEETAREMALGALKASGANLSLSVTGIAGPGGSDHKPEGRVCYALAHTNGALESHSIDFGALGRRQVRLMATQHGLKLLWHALSVS